MSLKNQKSIKPALVLPQGARVLQIHPGFVQKVSRPPSSLSDAMSTVSTLGATAQGATMDKPKRKRQRLDHLSQEEKIMRRKLKNRMAAQSARDRKKVKMLDLEGECVRIASTNERLVKRNAHLEKELRNLKAENALLRRRLEMSDLEPVSSSTVGDDLLKELMASTGLDALKHEEINEEELEEYYDDDQSDELSECDSGHESLEPSSSSPSSSVSGGSPAAHRAQHRPALAPGHAHSTNAILDDSFESAALISEPQQKDQEQSRVAAAERAAAQEAEAAAALQDVALVVDLSTMDEEEPHHAAISSTSQPASPLNLTSTLRRPRTCSARANRQASPPCSTSSSTSSRLMSFLILLCSLLMQNQGVALGPEMEPIFAGLEEMVFSAAPSRSPSPKLSSSSSPRSTPHLNSAAMRDLVRRVRKRSSHHRPPLT